MKTRKAQPVEYPAHLTHHDSLHIVNKGEFVPGDSVWVEGWSRSKRASYTLLKIVENTATGDWWVDVWELTPTAARIRSVSPDRLGKRRVKV
jgi:hypothetical protein